MGPRNKEKKPDISHQFSDALSREKVVTKGAKNAPQKQPRSNKIATEVAAEVKMLPSSGTAAPSIEDTTRRRSSGADANQSKATPPKRSSSTRTKVITTESETAGDREGDAKEDGVDSRKEEAKGKYNIFVQTRQCEELCSNLGLTMSDIRKMKRKYDDNDMYHSGEITQAEFFFMINEDRRPLTLGIFKLADVKETQKFLSFDDYLLCVVKFAVFTKPELYQFVFDLYDDDQSGALDEREFTKMSLELQSPQFHFPANVATAIKMLEGKEGRAALAPDDGLVDLGEFMKFARNFPVAFYPIMNMQKNVRAATLGESRWSRITANKLKVQELVSYMRRQRGAVPQLSLRELAASVFSNEIFNIRKRAGEIYALELAQRHHLGTGEMEES